MFELPEIATLARQLNASVAGSEVVSCVRGNSPHKYVWYNLSAPEYAATAVGRTIGQATARAKWLFVPLGPGLVQAFGEFGGRLVLHAPGTARPSRHHLLFELADGRALSVMTQMWGMFSLMTPAEIAAHKYAGQIGVTPVDAEFTPAYFADLVAEQAAMQSRSAKGLLTQDGIIPGIGNSYCQDILFQARIHPRRQLGTLSTGEVHALYEALLDVVNSAITAGGREDEIDLYGAHGGYVRQMSQKTAGSPCPACGTVIEKIQYLGGACYLCPSCQR